MGSMITVYAPIRLHLIASIIAHILVKHFVKHLTNNP